MANIASTMAALLAQRAPAFERVAAAAIESGAATETSMARTMASSIEIGFERDATGVLQLVPHTPRSAELLAAPYVTERLQSIAQATQAALDRTPLGGHVAGLRLDTDSDAATLTRYASMVEWGSVAAPRDGIQAVGGIRDAADVGNDNAHNLANWLVLGPTWSTRLLDHLASPTGADGATQAQLGHLLLHESLHGANHMPGSQFAKLGYTQGNLEELATEGATLFPSVLEQFHTEAGLAPLTPELRQVSEASTGYDFLRTPARRLAELSGIDPDDPAGAGAALQLFRGAPLAELPDAIGARVGAAQHDPQLGRDIASMLADRPLDGDRMARVEALIDPPTTAGRPPLTPARSR